MKVESRRLKRKRQALDWRTTINTILETGKGRRAMRPNDNKELTTTATATAPKNRTSRKLRCSRLTCEVEFEGRKRAQIEQGNGQSKGKLTLRKLQRKIHKLRQRPTNVCVPVNNFLLSDT
ncbi:hypothetical protein RUM43_002601, partial [Polyplax serrata]